MHLSILPEPELEFAGGRHISPRHGLMFYGPSDATSATAPKRIRVGIIGIEHDVAGLKAWLERCRSEIAGHPAPAARMRNFYPLFPGFSSGQAFDSVLEFDQRATKTIRVRDIEALQALSPADAASRAADLYAQAASDIAEEGWADVILCCRPDLPEPDIGRARSPGELDFHDVLKARAMRHNRPLQLIRRTTWGDKSHPIATGASTQTRSDGRTTQDEATRAWNLHTALYYKAGGVPWRMRRRSTDLTTCYVGISFYRHPDNDRLQTAVAQVFNQLGDGVVVRGAQATPYKDDKQPHLAGPDAEALLAEAMRRYREEHKNMPARIVVHKTSAYTPEEAEAFLAASDRAFVDSIDLIWVTRSDRTRVFRAGANNPPLRGTLLERTARQAVLYTRGTVPFYEAYPAMYIPRPIGLRIERSDRPLQHLAEEALALSKMNWNDTRLDGKEPITLRTASQVGDVLRFAAPEQSIPGRYAYFM